MKLETILVAVDFSPLSLAAARRACLLAGARGTVRLMHVVASDLVPRHAFLGRDLVARFLDSLEADAATSLRDMASKLHGVGQARIETQVCRGRPADCIVADAETADLLVVGAHAQDLLGRIALGSVAEAVARDSTTPVLVVREGAEGSPAVERVLVSVDVSDPNDTALEAANDLSNALGARLEAIHVVATPIHLPAYRGGGTASEVAQDVENRIRDEAPRALRALVSSTLGKSAAIHVAYGSPAAEVLRVARPADVIVCGTHGRGLLGRLVLGSVSQKLLREAPCPVLVVRPRKDSH